MASPRSILIVVCLALTALGSTGCRTQGASLHDDTMFRELGLTFEHMGEHRSSFEHLAETGRLFWAGEDPAGVIEAFRHGASGQRGLGVASYDLFVEIMGPYHFYDLIDTIQRMGR